MLENKITTEVIVSHLDVKISRDINYLKKRVMKEIAYGMREHILNKITDDNIVREEDSKGLKFSSSLYVFTANELLAFKRRLSEKYRDASLNEKVKFSSNTK